MTCSLRALLCPMAWRTRRATFSVTYPETLPGTLSAERRSRPRRYGRVPARRASARPGAWSAGGGILASLRLRAGVPGDAGDPERAGDPEVAGDPERARDLGPAAWSRRSARRSAR
jgi:hypothetical protein